MTKFIVSEEANDFPGNWGAPGGFIARITTEAGEPICQVAAQFDIDPSMTQSYRGAVRVDVKDLESKAFGIVDFRIIAEMLMLITEQQEQLGAELFYSDVFLDSGGEPRTFEFENKLGGIYAVTTPTPA